MAATVSSGCGRRAETRVQLVIAGATGTRRQEVRVIEEIEEVGLEGQRRRLRHLELLGHVEVHVAEVRAEDAVPPDWRIAPQATVDRRWTTSANPIVYVEVPFTWATAEYRTHWTDRGH